MSRNARYELIAAHYARNIQDGLLYAGERLPSLRTLCRRESVSLMTALAAYRRLEQLGLVEAQERSGYRVRDQAAAQVLRSPMRRPRLAQPSRKREVLADQMLAAVADPSLVPLGMGVPSRTLFPLQELRRVSTKLLRTKPELWASYSPPPGDRALRRLIALRLRDRGLQVGVDEVLLTAGAMEALSLALRVLVRPGDAVAVECPTFFGILDAARGVGARVIELPTDAKSGLDPAHLDAACRQHSIRAVVLVPSFGNPSGGLMPDERKQRWATLLHKQGVGVIEDDLYGELAHDGRAVAPLVSFSREGSGEPPALLVGSFSKTLLPGGRVGYVVARGSWAEKLKRLKQSTSLANVTLPEQVVATFLSSGTYQRQLRKMRSAFADGVATLRGEIAEHFPSGTKVSHPRGGFLLWVELPPGCDGVSLFHAAIARGISIAPGSLFTLGPGFERFIRLNAGAAVERKDSIATLGKLARRQQASGNA
jgi:DNA-binding transcriptional MocR family regulator